MFTRRSIVSGTAGGVAHYFGNTGRADALAVAAAGNGTIAPDTIRSEAINVVDFGADPTGRDDSSDAILRAIEQCFQGPDSDVPKAVYFPKGRFLITKNNIFHATPRPRSIRAWIISGAGRNTTTLIFRPKPPEASPSTFYLYDGKVDDIAANETLLGLTFNDISVNLDCSDLSRGQTISCFRQYGTNRSKNPEQSWTFTNCSFRGDQRNIRANGAILEIIGEANGSENAFINCRAILFAHVIDCLNPQAVNHLSLFCHWEVIFGDMFRFIRGGNLTLYGGSLIMCNFGDAPEWKPQTVYPPNATVYFDGRRYRTGEGGQSGSDPIGQLSPSHYDGGVSWTFEEDESAYILRVGGDLNGQINSFLISGPRIELRCNKAKLLAGGDLNTGAFIVFDSVAVQPVIGGPRHTIEFAESGMNVHFLSCKLSRASGKWDEPFAAIFGAFPNRRPRQGTRILLQGCMVSEEIHRFSRWGENSNAEISLKECMIGYRNPPSDVGQSRTTIVNGSVIALSHPQARDTARDSRCLRVSFDAWPGNAPADLIKITLPPQAILTRAYFVKQGAGAEAIPYQLVMRDTSGHELFHSSELNIGGTFNVDTPRLHAYSRDGVFQFSIEGSAYKGKPIKAGRDDYIMVEWIA